MSPYFSICKICLLLYHDEKNQEKIGRNKTFRKLIVTLKFGLIGLFVI